MKLEALRVGHGYDVHRFAAPGATQKPLIIGGITIPHDRGLVAHSDGDVLIHALCDALLGAAGAGDIGQHFPDSDPSYRNIDSSRLLLNTLELLARSDWQLVNADLTVVAETPRLAPFRQQMATRLAALLGVTPDRVNIKATTSESMGFVGRKEGICAYAVVLLGKPSP